MELPIDHFRLLGLSPSAEAEAVLRTLQVRLDHFPDQGFTHDALMKRAELLRLSADLLTDSSRRKEYEVALLSGATGLEVPSTREVAGLILLWEANASHEAFRLACSGLRPPQTPALGSGRESDLTLIAALACSSAALQDQEQRHYESAAILLQEGLQLLQRMGKLPQQRKLLSEGLEALMPYRILDLVSRDLGDQVSHQEGIRLLDSFVIQRGGIEGGISNANSGKKDLDQEEFELFFQQIRRFLTVQEQIDLFTSWRKAGSPDSGFLAVLALTAAGFSRRKPQRLFDARKLLLKINQEGFDSMPLLGCLDLLLAEIDQAQEHFQKSVDSELQNWLANFPGERLAALCEYCIDWLRKDVLVGYRDVEVEAVDLEAWFADRDVQEYLERLENKGFLGVAQANNAFSFFTSLSSQDEISYPDNNEELSINQYPGSSEISSLNKAREPENDSLEDIPNEVTSLRKIYIDSFNSLRSYLDKITSRNVTFLIGSAAFIAVFLTVGGIDLFVSRSRIQTNRVSEENSLSDLQILSELESENDSNSEPENESILGIDLAPLTSKNPSEAELREVIEAWLNSKSIILAGGKTDLLEKIAREPLVKRVFKERLKDASVGEIQKVQATINSLEVISQTSSRIAVKTRLTYWDKRFGPEGEIISETSFPSLKVTYIFGKDGDTWRLHEYLSGS